MSYLEKEEDIFKECREKGPTAFLVSSHIPQLFFANYSCFIIKCSLKYMRYAVRTESNQPVVSLRV